MFFRKIGNLALMSGQPDFSMTIASDPGVVRSISHVAPLGSPGETNIRNIMNKECMIKVNLAEGAVVPMTPGVYYKPGTALYTTPLSFVSSAFYYWTGDLSLRVQIVGAPLVRWRLGFVVVPPGETAPGSFPTNGSFLTSIVEVAGTTEIEMTIPYLHLNPFQIFQFIANDDASTTHTRVLWYDLTDPTGPSGTTVYPYVNLWLKAGPTFSVALPDLSTLNRYKIVNQGVDLGNNGEIGIATFGEIFVSLEQMCKRSVRYLHNVTAFNLPAASSFFALPVMPFVPQDTFAAAQIDCTSNEWSFVSWFSTAFIGNTGSYVYRICAKDELALNANEFTITEGISVMGEVPPVTAGKWTYMPTSRGASYWNEESEMAEIRMVDRNPLSFRQGFSVGVNNSTVPIECIIIDGASSSHIYDVYVAAGEDFRLQGWLNSPPLWVRA